MATTKRVPNPEGHKKLKRILAELQDLEVRVGWFETNYYPLEKGRKPVPVAYVATIHEWGDPESGIPARPFMRPTVARERKNWEAYVASAAKDVVAGTLSMEDMFEALGLNVSGEIARSIAAVTAPELKKATIAAKRRKMANTGLTGRLDKPLVETGLMIDTVTHIVEKP